MTATPGSDVVQSGRPIFDDFFLHLWPFIDNNTANVVFQMVKLERYYPRIKGKGDECNRKWGYKTAAVCIQIHIRVLLFPCRRCASVVKSERMEHSGWISLVSE
ncbi:hypothetical protein TNCV_4013451 [Trichonephila clavipes]|nr:hypothetical protein TNCV_4013451 [Trichonephila clavipes]